MSPWCARIILIPVRRLVRGGAPGVCSRRQELVRALRTARSSRPGARRAWSLHLLSVRRSQATLILATDVLFPRRDRTLKVRPRVVRRGGNGRAMGRGNFLGVSTCQTTLRSLRMETLLPIIQLIKIMSILLLKEKGPVRSMWSYYPSGGAVNRASGGDPSVEARTTPHVPLADRPQLG